MNHSDSKIFSLLADIVQSTFLIAGGASLDDIGLKQENIVPRGVAMQCRITTEDPGKTYHHNTITYLRCTCI
jgi:pyruvate carboxylase